MDKARLAEPARAVEAFLAEFLDARPYPANLREAVRYALLGGGKRLRPVLTVHCCRAVGGSVDLALPPAGAIELIHTFSLVHDDLPAMDNDDLRRGRPTLHRHTNEAMAILAGDGMTLLAFEMVFAKVRPPSLAARVASELATATNEMIAGQVYDTLPEFDESMDGLARLQVIHRHKTGALLRCACRMGAIVGGADEAGLDAITRYGETIGLMFQVVDDILDVTQTTEHLGKTARKDEAQGKLTYPSVLGLDASRAEVTRLQAQAHDALRDLGEPAAPLRELCDYMAIRSN